MELNDAIRLINHERLKGREPVTWADLGCGNGLFSFALANLVAEGSLIYATDNSNRPLTTLEKPASTLVKQLPFDFVLDEWTAPELDGILAANSLHFVSDKLSLLMKISHWIKNSGSLLLVEYDTNRANPWVPYPLTIQQWRTLFGQAGFATFQQLNMLPSAYNRAMLFSALVEK